MAWIVMYFLVGAIFGMLAYSRLEMPDFDVSGFEEQFGRKPNTSDTIGASIIVALLWPLAIAGGVYYALTR